ncbi:hypothetical protein [Flavicella marina]|nr:hypothetical protein [Flavicella marina]
MITTFKELANIPNEVLYHEHENGISSPRCVLGYFVFFLVGLKF